MNRFWPLALRTPHVELGAPVDEALKVLKSTGGALVAETDGEGKLYRAELPTYEMAVYHKQGVVSAVWYNDPAGRLTPFGRRRKLELYMQRFTKNGSWELRIDNGWMRFYFNDTDGACAVYGLHKDVVRINAE